MSVTESDSRYNDLEKKSIRELLTAINTEDQTVPLAVKEAIPQITDQAEAVLNKMKTGGRLFYIGAGTSGRLGIVDASECPPTFGVPHDWVIGLMAGGDTAIRKAVEFAEDDTEQAWKDLMQHQITDKDVVVGIAASGGTPYVVGGLKDSRTHGLVTGCITCNNNTEVAKYADFPVEVIVGPEVVTGSTRMKAGTAQKLVLNMLTTSVMIGLGRVKGNKMVDMQLSNNKLVNRGELMLMRELSVERGEAARLLQKYGSVRKAIEAYQKR